MSALLITPDALWGRCRCGCDSMLVRDRYARPADLPTGYRIHKARGLCRAGYRAALRRPGGIEQYPRSNRTSAELAEAAAPLLRDGLTHAQVAQQLQVPRRTLRSALVRVRRSGYRGLVQPRRRWSAAWVNPDLFDPDTGDEGG